MSAMGSMRQTVGIRAATSNYPLPLWLCEWAGDMGLTPKTAKGRAHAPGNVFEQVELALAAMVRHGNLDLAEQKMQRFEAVFCGEVPPLHEALRDELAADARQDIARGRYLLDQSTDSLSHIERETIREIVEKQQLLRAIAKAKRGGHTEKGAGQ